MDVLVIGAGPAGIGAAVKLRELGFDAHVIEKASALGGTWRDNVYPGCACDIPSALYSYSFAPRRWSSAFSGQPEILEYLVETAAAHGVVPQYDTEMLDAAWDGSRWQVRTSSGVMSARAIVSATGPWHEPKIPLDASVFEGEIFHSARWQDFSGRRVAVVGTGASAVQFVPRIQPSVDQLYLFQRTAPWVLPKPSLKLPRSVVFGLLELFSYGFRHPRVMKVVQQLGLLHLRRAVRDRGLRSALTPDFVLGCKRLLMSNTYYPALAQPNVSVVPHAVQGFTADGIIGADGVERKVDTIIFGTGFHFSDPPIASRVRVDGVSLAERWRGSPQAYLGTSVHGFPNLFLLLGPNLGTGHSSAFTIIETQLRYIASALTSLRSLGWPVVDVRPSVQAAFNSAVQAALQRTVYNAGGCTSYYLDANGRNSTMWPWSTVRMMRRIRSFEPSDYVISAVSDEQVATRSR
ncbi:cyclohexanone monooxygenase [Lentzea aerocolonigenes]|uniref:Cyclohexanone monooxygenase n=1 Tax=Lentzea aerocolonigenes TaxID=68170 RepID=A0A0F0H3E7_LENAE|nr:NAD(P)/FAD-dependent oxidoreductase [Lentzea aerocolonigenes]KJK48822.1 cyclohexanone monooxygenase [Lentzea aerocolonigenes]